MDPRGYQSGDVRHVHDEDRADLVGDAFEHREIDDARVGATAADQDAGTFAARDLAHLVVINPAGVFPDSVMSGMEQRPRKVHGRAVGQMAAVRQRQRVLLPLHLTADQLEHGRVRLGERRAPINHASIFATRRSWRPPSNAVSSHLCKISIPSSSLTNRDGSTSTFASLCLRASSAISGVHASAARTRGKRRSEEHTSELQSLAYLVCRLLLEKKNKNHMSTPNCTLLIT